MEPFNPLDPRLIVDPYPLYAELRTGDPVHLSAMGAYVLTRYTDVQQMLSDSETFQHQYVAQQKQRTGESVEAEAYFGYFRRMISVLDDPDHRRLRRLVTAAFTPRRIRKLRSTAEFIAADLLNSAPNGMEYVSDFALPFPLRVIGSILGIPEADHLKIGGHATALNPVLEFLPMSDAVLAKANASAETLAEYFSDLAEQRRQEPTDDLFSALVHASEAGDQLSNDELIANAILLYVAGHETTAGGSALALLSLYNNPEQLAALTNDHSLIPGAVEELLRYDTPGQGTARVVMKPTRFGETEVDAGNFVLGYLGAANRDPDAFPNPNELDVRRDVTTTRPLTWGGGAHFCLGRNLAIQELEVALISLLSHHPAATIAMDQVEFRETPLMRGLKSMPISW